MTRAATQTEYNRQRKALWRAANPDKARKQNRKKNPERSRPFVGVDGEGYDMLDGNHAYNMLRVGGFFLAANHGGYLSTLDCLEFLANLDPKPIYVAYFFDYDVTKILQDLSWYKLSRLMNRASRERTAEDGTKQGVWPVDVFGGRFEIDYLPRKEFKVRNWRCPEGCNHEDEESCKAGKWGPWIVINDVGSFFQCRFIKALETWNIGTPEERAEIALGKDLRNTHTVQDFERIKRYNALECRKLAQLMEEFRKACLDVGYVPRKWQGPGQIAETMLSVNGLSKSRDVPLLSDPTKRGLLAFARNAFYGGRPETSAIGPIEVPVYQWDINGAYPYALLHVPCLTHGKWTHRTGRELSTEDLSICYGSFEPNVTKERSPSGRPLLYGLPFRAENGTIQYPGAGRGWYWGFEINASVHQTFHCEEQWVYKKQCDCQPFKFILDTYRLRKALGKDARGIVLKLALNSLYGKMAQSIGSPKYANPIWASFITAFCRTQIQNLIHSTHKEGQICGEGVFMIATDAVFTSHELEIEPSEELGGFSLEFHPTGIFIIQPGVYFGSNGKDPKTRGIPQSAVVEHRAEFEELFDRMCLGDDFSETAVRLPIRTFVGIRQALHRHNLSIMGQWLEPENGRAISFDPTSKRDPRYIFPNWMFGSRHLTTVPHFGSPELETVPYRKDIGALFQEDRMMWEEQPDWVSTPVDGDQ